MNNFSDPSILFIYLSCLYLFRSLLLLYGRSFIILRPLLCRINILIKHLLPHPLLIHFITQNTPDIPRQSYFRF